MVTGCLGAVFRKVGHVGVGDEILGAGVRPWGLLVLQDKDEDRGCSVENDYKE
jgi:hypothetical protein